MVTNYHRLPIGLEPELDVPHAAAAVRAVEAHAAVLEGAAVDRAAAHERRRLGRDAMRRDVM